MLEPREAKVRRQVLLVLIKITKLTQPSPFHLPLHQAATVFLKLSEIQAPTYFPGFALIYVCTPRFNKLNPHPQNSSFFVLTLSFNMLSNSL